MTDMYDEKKVPEFTLPPYQHEDHGSEVRCCRFKVVAALSLSRAWCPRKSPRADPMMMYFAVVTALRGDGDDDPKD